MMGLMKQRILSFCVAALTVLYAPLLALAEDEVKYNPRLVGYKTNVAVPDRSSALTWILLLFLAAICVAVLFKNAKRTHLD
jgi:hypothetical protein